MSFLNKKWLQTLTFSLSPLILFCINEELDPDDYLDEIAFLNTKYYVPDEVKDQLKSLQLNSFSVLRLNIRSMEKRFEAFPDFIESLNNEFSAICLSETWLQFTKFQIHIFSCHDIIAFT